MNKKTVKKIRKEVSKLRGQIIHELKSAPFKVRLITALLILRGVKRIKREGGR